MGEPQTHNLIKHCLPLNAPVLYSFRRCPYAMRARLALLTAGIRCELREVALAQKPQSLLLASPKGTVPVLVLPDRLIEQSMDIMLWALQQSDPQSWLPEDAGTLKTQLAFVDQFEDLFKHHLDRYKYPSRYGLKDGMVHRDTAALQLHELNKKLNSATFLSGQSWGLVDAAIVPFVRQFAKVDFTWFEAQNWFALRTWLGFFENSNDYSVCMHKYKVWHPDHKPTAFPHS
ncbi:MAG: glutathione S-transferase N-terminal domain-containing protein [Limnohabitans sp.]